MSWYTNATTTYIDTKSYVSSNIVTTTTTSTTSTTIDGSHTAFSETTIAKNSDRTPNRAEQTQSVPWYDTNSHTANVTKDRCWRFVCLAAMVNTEHVHEESNMVKIVIRKVWEQIPCSPLTKLYYNRMERNVTKINPSECACVRVWRCVNYFIKFKIQERHSYKNR